MLSSEPCLNVGSQTIAIRQQPSGPKAENTASLEFDWFHFSPVPACIGHHRAEAFLSTVGGTS